MWDHSLDARRRLSAGVADYAYFGNNRKRNSIFQVVRIHYTK